MIRKVAAVFLALAWVALFSFELLDDLEFGGSTAYGSRPVKAALVSLGNGINQEDEGRVTACCKLPYQAKYFYPLPIESIFSFGAKEEVKIQKEDLKLYKLHSVFLI
ncbi:MAG: hypothetical protein HYT78_00215 [Deltaproteobacteria bacterium]|nr:hypothetical protein [Deltaproteobacteria bacterium]